VKTDGVGRGKRFKRTERLRNLESELKRSLHAATAHPLPAATDTDDDDVDGVGLVPPPPRPRIIISGFSNSLINGTYEESGEQGHGTYRVLRHVNDENLCMEWLNGAWRRSPAAAASK
jgi:hypothetical protein